MATITSLSFRMNSFYNGEGMARARRDIARLDSSMNAMEKSARALMPGMKDFVSLLMGIGPAVVPIAAGLASIGAAATSAFAAAGAAVGIYGAAMKGAITATVGTGSAFDDTNKAIGKAEQKLRNTTKGTEEYRKAQEALTEATKAHEDAIESMAPAQEKFARTYDDMEGALSAFNNENAKFTLGPATTAMEAFIASLPKFQTVIKAIHPEIQRIADLTKAWVTDGGLDRFLIFVKTYGVPALHGFVEAARDLFAALGVGMRDTAPLGMAFVKWLQDTMAAFRGWAEGGGFQRFLEYLENNKGQLIQTVKDLGTFMKNLGAAVANMSGGALTVLGTFFKVLASFPPGLLEALMYAFIGFTLAMKIYAGVALIAALYTTYLTLAATGLGVIMMGMALTIAGVVLAIIAVGVGIYFLVKYWDTVWNAIKDAALAVWGALKTAWETTWNFIKGIAMAVWGFLTEGWGQVLLFFVPFGPILVLLNNWDMVWGKIKEIASAVWQWIQGAWDATLRWLYDKWIAFISPITESWGAVWPQLKEAALNVWNALKAAWEFLWSGIKLAWEVFWAIFGPTIKAAWTGAVETVIATWGALTAAWKFVWTTIQSIFSVAWSILSGAWKIGWTVLVEAAKIAWAILTGAWQVVWSVVTGIWNTFYSTFSGIFRAAWDVLVSVATGIWNVIKAAWDALWKTITAIFTTFMAIFTGNWGAAWNSIKDAAAAIWNVIRTAWQAFLDVLRTLLEGFINIIKAAWQAFWTAVQNTAMTFWNALRTLFQTSLTAVQNLWNTVWTAVRTIFQTIVNAIMSIATSWWSAFRAALGAFLTAVQNLWNTVWTAIRTFFQTISTGLQTAASSLWEGLRNIFSAGSNWLRTTFWNPVSNFFTKTIPDAFESAKNALGKAWDGIKKLVRAPIQAVVDIVYNNGIVKLWNMVAGVFSAPKLSEFNLPQFKEGGPTGSGSSNGFPAIMHPNEHVWTAREVSAAGGHEAVARMRSQVLGGKHVRTYGNGVFDEGGGILGTGWGWDVGPDLVPDGIIKNAWNKLKDVTLGAVHAAIKPPIDAAVKLAQAGVRAVVPGSGSGIEKLGESIPRKIGDTVLSWIKDHDIAPETAGGSVEAALQWALAQVGKPYQWGGVGPGGYDCSGFMGAIQNVIMGKGPHSRVWATGAFSGSTAPSGWKKSESAPFMVGITNAGVGHTAGTLNGTNVESRGGKGVVVGKGARGYKDGMFTDWYGFVPSKSVGEGKSPAQAKAIAKGMLAGYGWDAHWPSLEALWTRESGWKWNADNPSSDAYGIPQALPGSKMASAGKDWKTNPSTQIKWGLGYIKSRYGNPTKANDFQRKNNWYGYGTRSATPGWGVVGDRGIELMKMRGGEQIEPLENFVGRGSGPGVTLTMHIDARGATASAVDKLNNELPDRLRMALEQHVGSRP